MITEDYVSFETAKLLAEKGIEDDCEYTGWIGESGNHYFPDDTYWDDDEIIAVQKDRKEFIPLISLQMAMKWLREVHNYDICICLDSYVEPYDNQYYILIRRRKNKYENISPCEQVYFDTYEEACEAAIKYCLENLI